MNLNIRKARMTDIPFIHDLLMSCSADRLLLPRSLSKLYSHLRDFYVIENEDALLGCAALAVVWENMAEVRSIAVQSKVRRQGYGRKLVEACIEEARGLAIERLFALTYQLPFFESLGFREVGKDVLPQKVWLDCINCPKFPDCDETAVLMNL